MYRLLTDNTSTENNNTPENNQEEMENINGEVTINKPFDSGKYVFSIIGLKEYERIDNEIYSDIPEEGNVFLALYINVKNHTAKDIYFPSTNMLAQVDEKEIENVCLYNKPNGYESIFGNIGFRNEKSGYIIWQVPKDWKEVNLAYEGLKFSDGISFTAKLSRDMLFDPPVIEE